MMLDPMGLGGIAKPAVDLELSPSVCTPADGGRPLHGRRSRRRVAITAGHRLGAGAGGIGIVADGDLVQVLSVSARRPGRAQRTVFPC